MVNLTINGVTYAYPQTGDINWGTGASSWAQAVTSGALFKSGGSFPLTAVVDFGSNYGVKVLNIQTESANPAGSGFLQLANSDGIGWRNAVNTADFLLKPDADGILQYNSIDLVNVSATQTLTNKTITGTFTGNLTGNASTATTATTASTVTTIPALSGDVTSSGSSNATTIAASVVSNAKLATMASGTVKGNVSGSTANPSDVSATSAATASTVSLRDANANIQYNNVNEAFVTQVTSATPVSLTVASAPQQQFTGSTAQTVNMPDCTTLVIGTQYQIYNRSTATITVKDKGGSTLVGMIAGTELTLTCASNGTAAGSWDLNYTYSGVSALPIVLGGTGSTTQQAALNALAPSSPTNGQVIAYNGTNWVAQTVPAGTKNYLTAITTSNGTNTGNGNFEFGSLTGWQFCTVGTLTNSLPTGTPTFTSTTNTLYTFTISSASATIGATYTNNSQTFTVVNTIASATTLVCTGTGAPSSSGTLTKASGTGASTITFSASTNLSASTVNSGQLAGSYSASLASSAATIAGQGFATNTFYIDNEDQAKVLQVKFYYTANAGSTNCNWSGTSSNSLAWAAWDVTNAAWLSSVGNFNFVQGTGVGTVTGTFQTGASTTQVVFVIYNANATSGSSTIYLDDVFVGPQTAPSGPAMTDWIAYTPTWTSASTSPAIGNGTLLGFYKREGDSAIIQIRLAAGSSTTFGGSNSWYFSIPSGLSIDSTKLPSGGDNSVGFAKGYSAGVNYSGIVSQDGTSGAVLIYTGTGATTNGWNSTYPATWTTSGNLALQFRVPIVGWSSNTAMSSDTDTRVVAMRAYVNTTQTGVTNGSDVQIQYNAVQYDTHGAFNTGTYSYTVPVSGYYKINMQVNESSTSGNGVLAYRHTTSGSSIYIGGGALSATRIGAAAQDYFAAGDIIAFYINQASGGSVSIATGNTNSFVTVQRLSGPAVIAATESVNMRYASSGTQSIPNATSTAVTLFTTKSYDSHNAFNSSTGVYTCPVSGKYRVTWQLATNSTVAASGANQSFQAQAWTNSSQVSNSIAVSVGTTAVTYATLYSDTINCVAGQTITPEVYTNLTGSAVTIGAAVVPMYITIERVGN